MSRRLAAIVVASVCIAALPGLAAAAPAIKVGNGKSGSCTEAALRDALALADAQGGGNISFKCGKGPITITVFETLTVPDNTTIHGDKDITLQAAVVGGTTQLSTLLNVESGSDVVLKDVHVVGAFHGIDNAGTLTLRNSTVASAIFNNIRNTGTLTVMNSTIRNEIFDIAGGGILNGGTLTVQDSTFLNNFGGGIDNLGTATAVVNYSTFSGNQFPEGVGGGLANFGTMVLRNCTIDGSQALRGGGIYNEGTLTIQSTGITGSVGFSTGGGIFNRGDLILTNSVITGNRSQAGGGIYTCCSGRTTLVRTSVTGNTPDNLRNAPGPFPAP